MASEYKRLKDRAENLADGGYHRQAQVYALLALAAALHKDEEDCYDFGPS
jgi:hypothetical protein